MSFSEFIDHYKNGTLMVIQSMALLLLARYFFYFANVFSSNISKWFEKKKENNFSMSNEFKVDEYPTKSLNSLDIRDNLTKTTNDDLYEQLEKYLEEFSLQNDQQNLENLSNNNDADIDSTYHYGKILKATKTVSNEN
jgi:hypothetical protein